MKLLVQRADAGPVAIVTAGVALALVPFLVPVSGVALAAIVTLSVAARVIAPVHQHCHAHRGVFALRPLNNLYDFVLMFAAGNLTVLWRLQHVFGHHVMHLDPRRDPAGVLRFSEGGRFHRLVYTVLGDLLSLPDAIRVALARANRGRLLRLSALWLGIQALTLGLLLFWNMKLALLLFVVPNLVLRWTVFYFSYGQHHGVPADDVYSGSVTRFGWTNAVFLNVGHHTAHHEQPSLHWTLLPARTQQILPHIPVACLEGAP